MLLIYFKFNKSKSFKFHSIIISFDNVVSKWSDVYIGMITLVWIVFVPILQR